MGRALVLFIIFLIPGCTSSPNAPNSYFVPIVNVDANTKAYYYERAKAEFSELGYQFMQNDVFTTLTTNQKSLGYLRWRVNSEKWDIHYQVHFQIVEPQEGDIYWKLDTYIWGERSGREPRVFGVIDFQETELIYENLMTAVGALFAQST